jgi:hypothetical protein
LLLRIVADWRNAVKFKDRIAIEPTGQRHLIELLQ